MRRSAFLDAVRRSDAAIKAGVLQVIARRWYYRPADGSGPPGRHGVLPRRGGAGHRPGYLVSVPRYDDAQGAGWWWLFEDFVMVCEPPTELHLEQVGPVRAGVAPTALRDRASGPVARRVLPVLLARDARAYCD